MKIIFDVWSFREMQKSCGAVKATPADGRPALERICLTFSMDYNRRPSSSDMCAAVCHAYGSNGYQITRMDVPCELSEMPDEKAQILLDHVKIPPKTETIILNTDRKDVLELAFINKEGGATITDQPKLEAGAPIDFGQMCKKFSNQIDQYNKGQGQYWIAVNPKYLINALEGMKDKESVMLHFGSQVQPFMIRPRDSESNVSAWVFPIRVL